MTLKDKKVSSGSRSCGTSDRLGSWCLNVHPLLEMSFYSTGVGDAGRAVGCLGPSRRVAITQLPPSGGRSIHEDGTTFCAYSASVASPLRPLDWSK